MNRFLLDTDRIAWINRHKLLVAGALVLLGMRAFVFESIEVDTPTLVVLVVFDQLRGDYPKRWEELYGDGGFKRLMKEGAWFTDCHYPYAYTLTAPGHASLA